MAKLLAARQPCSQLARLMFSLGVRELHDEILRPAPWAFLCCASFEPRWDAFARRIGKLGGQPDSSLALQPVNATSRWSVECAQKQAENWAKSAVRSRWGALEQPTELPSPLAWRDAVSIVSTLRRATTAEVLVVDITTMPRSTFFPVIKAALSSAEFQTVVAVYSEPGVYHSGNLASEPTNVSILSGFDQLTMAAGTARQDAAWIPILGFGPQFLTTVYESVMDTFEIASRVYPVLGFPAFEPRFFERALSDSGRAVLDLLKRSDTYGDQFVYSAATDPFDTATALARVVESSPDGLAWLGTPTGPKPMALGMLLAALAHPITVLIAPPRTYHPAYSSGSRRTHAYLLRRDGRPAY